ncbi:hypothetical protein [Pseudodesulfovibrio sp.]|uniref:hypothetical protein n=1 Tax=Pseudodesulfovibrio sp. TaxID=2035812 RepID=UPI0026303045|nr:hypothetical protein [Pseudodesulfovibrio sp.]MDD3311134.1 hypothetical protein [Pseudodesulfovibrio sp.]
MTGDSPESGRVEELVRSLSVERLQPYRLPKKVSPDEGDYDWLLRYVWNIRLCESLYPGLQNLETALRNGMHGALSAAYGTEFWFREEGLLDGHERKLLLRAESHIPANRRKVAGKYVAELNFGFWASLLHRRYHDSLVPKVMKAAFPRRTQPLKRSTVAGEPEAIRKPRNRVFHHEPIWNNPQLAALHNLILQYIAWLNYELFLVTRGVDRFEEVHGAGTAPYKETIAQIG